MFRPLSVFIGTRYTGAKRRNHFISFIALTSMIGLALGVTMPLVSLRLASWGHGSFAIGVMAATPAIGVLLGAALVGVGCG